MSNRQDPWLLTPGPLTTSLSVKQSMLHDWGSRDQEFIRINAEVREKLVAIVGAEDSHVCVPVQGSGTFTVEATLGTLIGSSDKALILVNGAYGKRICKILDYYQRQYSVIEWAENEPIDVKAVDDALSADSSITYAVAVHCETTSGIINPIEEIAAVTATRGRKFIIDAMAAFGAIELDAKTTPFDAVVASSNKCLEGVPGVGFSIIRKTTLDQCKGNSPSLSLDLYDQHQAMEANNQWRFTPPTHVIVALHKALEEHSAEGGVSGRWKRYRNNCDILVSGMRALGFETLLSDTLQAPIIVTFHLPSHPNFNFQKFYDALNAKGFVIYPGKLTVAESFRIGCIGRINEIEIRAALAAIEQTLAELQISDLGANFASAVNN